MRTALLPVAFASLASCMPAAIGPRAGSLPPKYSIVSLGATTSTMSNIYRDGGGGGTINGLNFIIFADTEYTSGGFPASDLSNLLNFTSNSIAYSNYNGGGPQSLQDFGTTAKGPFQQIPFFYSNGESESKTAIWPNQNIGTLCSGICGVSFPEVINRTAFAAGEDPSLYNTGVQIGLTGYGPVVTRPTQKLFLKGEPLFGTFSNLVGIDGYLYMFAHITHTTSGNGLKVARVPQTGWSDRSKYQYWNGNSWTATMPAYDDGGASNIFNFSQPAFGTTYGPGTGDLFYSSYYGTYLLIFQCDNGLDSSVYMSYTQSVDFTKGWSTPTVIYNLPTPSGGFSYSFHAYPNYDSTSKVIPISWSETSSTDLVIAMANITFS